jgi:hypothetical protein
MISLSGVKRFYRVLSASMILSCWKKEPKLGEYLLHPLKHTSNPSGMALIRTVAGVSDSKEWSCFSSLSQIYERQHGFRVIPNAWLLNFSEFKYLT